MTEKSTLRGPLVSGRTLAIGDIHGCDTALKTLLPALSITRADTVVVLGDVVDRGPGSRQVIERLLALASECSLVLILGNHEQMMVESLRGNGPVQAWLRYGGRETLASYGDDPRNIPAEHLDFLRAGRDYWETPGELFIHASLEPGVALNQQTEEWLRWTHLSGHEVPLSSGKRVICGHTPQMTGIPLMFPGWICIDTYACGTGWLTCLEVGSDNYYQASQSGGFRTGRLEEICA
jgi:serine/threonine protein phosphatase 1